MAIRNIVTEGDPILRKVCRPVTDFGARTAQLLDDMHETLAEAQGAGLAAPQVGIMRRLCLVMDNDGTILEMLNPEILSVGEETEGAYEGCLSVPGKRGYVERPLNVTVRAQNREGEMITYELEGFAARCVLHETDHLDGRLYIDMVDELLTEEELDELLASAETEEE